MHDHHAHKPLTANMGLVQAMFRQAPISDLSARCMSRIVTLILAMVLFVISPTGPNALAQNSPDEITADSGAGEILAKIEQRYKGGRFSARFHQTATIKAIDIIDTAQGKIFVERPGKMRWEYETPQPQLIVTDGRTLWVYRPDENQVMTGPAPDYFGDGKGASFLSDVKTIRHNFVISRVDDLKSVFYKLRLIPHKPLPDITDITLSISKIDFEIVHIATTNTYGDETLIELRDVRLEQDLDDSLFRLKVPPGTEVLRMQPPQ